MSKFVRYSGSTPTLGGHVCRCDILQEAANDFPSIGDLDIESLTIEWPEIPLEDPLCFSMATLVINSPGDRTYIDLYSVKPCLIRLDVYLDDKIYWSGCLDPEFYEEPYSSGQNYSVSLTFSDFGVLGRIPYDLSGRVTLLTILETALSRSGVAALPIDETLISTEFEDGEPLSLESLSIPSENFFDEDGIASPFKDSLEGILQPLGLRMIQRSGVVWIYDINALLTKGAPVKSVRWDADDQVIGVNNVYNNIIITFSPYPSKGSRTGTLDYGDTHGPEWTNLTSQAGEAKYNGGQAPAGMAIPECYSYYPDYDSSHRHGSDWDYNLVDFTIFRSRDSNKCKGLGAIGANNMYFKIQPVLGGSESAGVAEGFYTGGHGSLESGYPVLKGINPTQHGKSIALATTRAYLPALSQDDRADNYLRILTDLLVDARYNPFEQKSSGNEEKNQENLEKYGGIALVPVAVVMYDERGDALCHWTNKSIVTNAHPGDSIAATLGSWEDGEATWGDAWLAWYDISEPIGGSALGSWNKNRQCFGVPMWFFTILAYRDGESMKPWWAFDSFLKAPEGQFIPYPPVGGHIEIRIYNGVWIFTPGDGFSEDLSSSSFSAKGLYGKLRWQLLGSPEITVVKRSLTLEEAGSDDIEYTGVINRDAKEDLDISTICGTTPESCPTALGNYISSATGLQIRKMRRAGRIDQVEHLLIGTLYSQYAERRTRLQGEIRIDDEGLSIYSERSQDPSVRLLITGESQDILSDCSAATLVEIRPDEYDGEVE